MNWKLNRLSLWTSLITLALAAAPPGFGQNLLQQKDLGFAQVAVGGGYETVMRSRASPWRRRSTLEPDRGR
jgi:hypothetical protein